MKNRQIELNEMFEQLTNTAQADIVKQVAEVKADEAEKIGNFISAMKKAGVKPSLVEKTVECYKSAS